jgi:hypothetical protein
LTSTSSSSIRALCPLLQGVQIVLCVALAAFTFEPFFSLDSASGPHRFSECPNPPPPGVKIRILHSILGLHVRLHPCTVSDRRLITSVISNHEKSCCMKAWDRAVLTTFQQINWENVQNKDCSRFIPQDAGLDLEQERHNCSMSRDTLV